MKVKFLECMGGKDFTYEAGEVYDLKKPVAERYVSHGICILDKSEKPVVKKPVVKKPVVKK